MELFVVIPCYNEPDVVGALQSIAQCDIPTSTITIIVVVNESEVATEDVLKCNQKSIADINNWEVTKPAWIQIIYKHAKQVPKKIAGVGHARKIGMDLAYDLSVNKKETIISCFDADCRCSKNYLNEVFEAFSTHPKHDVASIYFEHDSKQGDAIVDYELFLRYHVQGLRFAGYPYAYQTIGSSMAVRANTYKEFGGMNLRKAGEDFYFLHKIIPYRNFLEINTCTVFPSARKSDRVPFGTGHAVAKQNASICKTYYTYHPAIYAQIKKLITTIEASTLIDGIDPKQIPSEINTFLANENFAHAVQQIQKQSKSDTLFHQNIYRWLNGFRMLKLVHYLRDMSFTNIPIHKAVQEFWWMLRKERILQSNKEWLDVFRSLEKATIV